MLKSCCIKTNNKQIINNLLNNFKDINLENVFVSKLKFKFYNNIIIHYKGNNLDSFYNIFSNIVSNTIIKFYETNIIKNMISINYFYFTDLEQKEIFDIVNKYINNNEFKESSLRKNLIKSSCIKYFSDNKSLILDGFVNFRLKDYLKSIDSLVDMAVNKFVIDREYNEFIDLLKCYINSRDYKVNKVHLIYENQESILLDDNKKIINIDNSILNNKYLSDISFSSNDYTLNTLLTLLPKKIYIHLINKKTDEFINTLKLIFDDRIYLCTDCDICNLYRLENINK